MALPRIIQQTCNYIESFESYGEGTFQDYIVVYGHSTVVVSSIIKTHSRKKYPVIVVKDRQYNKSSSDEHVTVCHKLKQANVDHVLIDIEDTLKLFDQNVRKITGLNGEEHIMYRSRRIQFFIGCERIDTYGNTLIPSLSLGQQSDTARFLQDINKHIRTSSRNQEVLARVVILAESFKVRCFDRNQDIQTHVPLRGLRLQRFLYLIGATNIKPAMSRVSLIYIKSEDIFAHINELEIFPCIKGNFNLEYCLTVLREDSRIRGLFSKKGGLKYKMFDEIEGVLFDLNGVIINDEEVHYHAFAETVRNFGVDLSLAQYYEMCSGLNDATGFKNIQKYLSESIDINWCVAKKQNAYLTELSRSEVKLENGSYQLFSELHFHGYKIALVTASSKGEAESILNKFQITHYFDAIITDDDVCISKPSSQGFELAAKTLGIIHSKCLVVEDSLENIAKAQELGMHTVQVCNQTNPKTTSGNSIFSINDLLIY